MRKRPPRLTARQRQAKLRRIRKDLPTEEQTDRHVAAQLRELLDVMEANSRHAMTRTTILLAVILVRRMIASTLETAPTPQERVHCPRPEAGKPRSPATPRVIRRGRDNRDTRCISNTSTTALPQ